MEVRQLGSLLGDAADVRRRMQLASVAFRSLYTLWLRREKVSLRRRVRLYNAFVLPVLLYNCGTWGLTRVMLDRLSAFHRKQLRSLAGVRYPHRVRNAALYKMTWSTSIEQHLQRARMRLFGHILRLSKETPAQKAMDMYFSPGRRRRGRPVTCLVTALRHDLSQVNECLRNVQDLERMRELALDRDRWRDLVQAVCRAQQQE